MPSTKNRIILGATLALLSGLLPSACPADLADFSFEITSPSNAGTIQVLDPDDDPYINQVIGNLTFEIQYRQNSGDPLITAGSVAYLLETDGAGFLIDNGGQHSTNYGVIPDVSEIQISLEANAAEWQAPGLGPWALDNVTLFKNNVDILFTWDYETDANASQIDPLVSSNGGLGDAWSGDLDSSTVTGGALEFVFPNGGGGGSSQVFFVASIPEPNSVAVFCVASFACLIRRRR